MKTNAIAVKYSGRIGMVYEYFKATKEVSKTFPVPRTYMLEEKIEQEYKNRIIKTCYGVADVKVGDWAYYTHKVNIGTKKYPYMIDKVEYDKVMSIGDKVCTMKCGDRPYHENIIAVYTGVL